MAAGGAPLACLCDLSAAAGSAVVTGIAVDPGETALYVTTLDSGNHSLVRFALPSGPAQPIKPLPALPPLGDVAWDEGSGRLLVASAGGTSDAIYRVDPVDAVCALAAMLPFGRGAAHADIDVLDFGSGVVALPQEVVASDAFDLHLRIGGPDGQGAVVFAAGILPPGAVFPTPIPPVTLLADTIGPRRIAAARIPIPAGVFLPGDPNVRFLLLGMNTITRNIMPLTPVTWPRS